MIMISFFIQSYKFVYSFQRILQSLKQTMGKAKNSNESIHQMRQFNNMVDKLHEMLQSIGQQSAGNDVLKLDEFEKLRRAFTLAASNYQTGNNQIKSISDKVQRAQLMFRIIQSKKTMQESLKQMTNLSIRLKQKINKEKVKPNDKYKTPLKKKKQWQADEHIFISDQIQKPQQQQVQKNPLEKQLQYKSLVLYNLQRTFYQLIQKERKQVAGTKKIVIKNKFQGLEELKKHAQNIKLMDEFQQQDLTHQEQLEQEDIIQAIKKLDYYIEARMVPILQNIQKMHGNALSISNSLTNVHKLVLINLQQTNKNQEDLRNAKKMLDKLTPHVRKASCICNVVLCFLLALVAFLLLKLFGVFDGSKGTPN